MAAPKGNSFAKGNKGGRPTDYTPDKGDLICSRLACGESLNKITKCDDMPAMPTVYEWLRKHDEFANNYARAREDQADTLADEILAIADTPQTGTKTKTDAEGGVEITEGDMIEHRRLQVDARKWIAAKLKPKKYGDKADVNLSGKLIVPLVQEIPDPT